MSSFHPIVHRRIEVGICCFAERYIERENHYHLPFPSLPPLPSFPPSLLLPLLLSALVLPLTLAQDVPDLVCPIPDLPVPGTEPSTCTTECSPPPCSDEGQLCCPTAPLCRDCVTAIRTRSEHCELDGEEVEAGTSTMAGDDCNRWWVLCETSVSNSSSMSTV